VTTRRARLRLASKPERMSKCPGPPPETALRAFDCPALFLEPLTLSGLTGSGGALHRSSLLAVKAANIVPWVDWRGRLLPHGYSDLT
jgi:hypothetical protein